MKNYTFLLALCLFFSCKNAETNTSETSTNETTEAQSTNSSKYTLTPFSASPEFPDAKISSMQYREGKFTFGVSGKSYELGAQTPDAPQKMCANSGKGQHIHLIIDNKPYAAKYTAEFEHDVADGEHYMLAFLSRSYHESIKTDKANVLYKIKVADKSLKDIKEMKEPMLTYSRPKGTYVGEADTKKVMLDFYVSNLSLGSDYKVKVDINGETAATLDTWQPYYIEGMPMGENTIKLTLVDGAGKTVETPLNPVERTFTLKADPAEG